MMDYSAAAKAYAMANIGRYLGFPECCIRAFKLNRCEETKKAHPEGPWWGTGFVPCAKCIKPCLENFEQFVAQNIAWRRQAPVPFPQDRWNGSKEIFEKFWKEAAKATKVAVAPKESFSDKLAWIAIRGLSAIGYY